LLPRDDVPTVAVVGAIGRDKGARKIERLAQRARERRARVRFVVIGYTDVHHGAWQAEDAVLTVHGPYARSDLPVLLAHYAARVIVYPSEGPESFSYTLSEVWRGGLPALVPPIGALAERVTQTGAGWVLSEREWRDDDAMLDRILALLADAGEIRDAATRARNTLLPLPDAMAGETFAHYERALSTAPTAAARFAFSNERIRDALGYVPWSPPQLAAPTPTSAAPAATGAAPVEPPHGVWQRVARRALAMRRTPMGRLLYRVTPEPVIDALKARLHG
jgi:glycosyltransferase involved in cell wall biosynthesis